MEYFIVQYVEDGILQVVSNVKKGRNSLMAKYYDGRYYDVKIISRNPSRIFLEDICRNLKSNVPVVILQRYNTDKCEGISSCEDDPVPDTPTDNTVISIGSEEIGNKGISSCEDDPVPDTPTDNTVISIGSEEIGNKGISSCEDDPVPDTPTDNTVISFGSEEIGNKGISSCEDDPVPDTPTDNTVTSIGSEEIATDCGNSWNYASEILAEAVRQDIIILRDEILVAKNTPDIQIMCGDVQVSASNSVPESFQPTSRSRFLPEMEDSVQNDINDHDKEKNKKALQKKHCCFYCQKVLFKIYRHYTTVHKTEKEVREIIVLPVKSEKRKQLLDTLRKKGDYFFNTTLKNENQSDILCRNTFRNGHETLRDKNVPCPQCLGYFSKLSIRHHVKNCLPMRACKRRLNIQAECRKLLNNIHKKASEDLKTRIFPFFNDDEVSNVIRYDEAIITYGNYMCRKYTTEHHSQQIRSNLRAFGRLILAIRELNPNIKELSEVLDPIQVELIINAIDKVAVLDTSSHLYKSPATAMLLATELKKLCKLLTMEYARNRDKEGQKRMEDLLLTFNLEFQVTVNKRGLETQKINNRRKKIILPKTEHIAEFRVYLEGRIRYFTNKLETCYCQKDWVHLAEYTLVHLAVFNRKRPGETQRILVDDYKNYEIVNEDDVLSETDALSKEQMKKWARIRLTGKLGKNTALLVHRDLGFKAIELILKYREKAGVNPANRYLFGEPSKTLTQNTFQACQLIRKFSYESEIENPELLRTRLLRQHLATETAQSRVDQRLEGRVSDFMSHKRQIHEDYYVMTQKTDDITKVSKLLENFSSVDGNSNHDTNKMKQKSQTIQQYSKGVASDEEYFPDRNDNYDSIERKRKSQSHPQSLEEVSDNDYISDENKNYNTQAELNAILGKKRTRHSWTSSEKSKAREYFYDEIFYGNTIQRDKIKEFHESNKELYKYRTPHLIMQWVKCQRNEVLAKESGIQGKRIRWSTPEKEVLCTSTERHSSEGTTPTLPECELIFEKNKSILKNRNPSSIKSFIYTEINKKRICQN